MSEPAPPPRAITALLCHSADQPDDEQSPMLDIHGATDQVWVINPVWPVVRTLQLVLIVRGVDYASQPKLAAMWLAPDGSDRIAFNMSVGPTIHHVDDWWGFTLIDQPFSVPGTYTLDLVLFHDGSPGGRRTHLAKLPFHIRAYEV